MKHHILAMVLCFLCQSCVTTSVWESPDKHIWLSRVQGFVTDSSETESRYLDFLLAKYSSSSSWPRGPIDHLYAIPCQNGEIPPQLLYHGRSRNSTAIFASISENQITTITKLYTPSAETLGRTISHSHQYFESGLFRVANTTGVETKSDDAKNIALVPYEINENRMMPSTKAPTARIHPSLGRSEAKPQDKDRPMNMER
ncbi:hypothetical protein LLG95_01930 [bacterium]|nr:hypothetical protein [bacterium]